MKRILYPLIMFLGLMGTTQAQGIPKALWGQWICSADPNLSRVLFHRQYREGPNVG
jgi:hypothetical protein